MKTIALSLGLFGLAALFEIGGGYLVWPAWRHGNHWALGVGGAALLVAYGVVPTYQPAHFGRVYAAYGGVFVVPSLAWGWAFDGVAPDRFDLTGAARVAGGPREARTFPATAEVESTRALIDACARPRRAKRSCPRPPPARPPRRLRELRRPHR